MINRLFSLIGGCLSYLNPFRKGFSRKEALVYCSRRQGPSGLWEKLPELHYCLFNRGKEHLLKTDVELQAGKVNPSKKTIILVTDDVAGQIAGLDLKGWVTALQASWNVVVIYLHESPQNVLFWKDVVTAGPLMRGDLPQVVSQEIQDLTKFTEVDAVIALSLESGEVLKPLREDGLPILHMIPEFLHTPRQLVRLKKSRRDATIQLFPNESELKRATDGMGVTADERMAILGVIPASALSARICELEQAACKLLEEEERQIGVIFDSEFFLKEYAVPSTPNERAAVRAYLGGWRSGWRPRKPCPGFHPGIYRDHHPDMLGDPTVEFIRAGKPDGPWLTDVLTGTESMLVKDGKTLRTALHVHLHYVESIEDLFRSIVAARSKPDLFISTTSEEGKARVKVVMERCGLHAQAITVFPNRGRDIGPFITGYGPSLFKDYEILGHLHSKKSPHAHDDYLQNWVEFLEKGLVGKTGGMMDVILDKMASDTSIGIVYPDDPGCFGWEENYTYGKALIERMGYNAPLPDTSMNFPVGTMFWARTAALKPLLDLNLQWEEYPEEPLPIDGSMLHAMERIFGILPNFLGYRTVVSAVKESSR